MKHKLLHKHSLGVILLHTSTKILSDDGFWEDVSPPALIAMRPPASGVRMEREDAAGGIEANSKGAKSRAKDAMRCRLGSMREHGLFGCIEGLN